jgi:hypothetical protein
MTECILTVFAIAKTENIAMGDGDHDTHFPFSLGTDRINYFCAGPDRTGSK